MQRIFDGNFDVCSPNLEKRARKRTTFFVQTDEPKVKKRKESPKKSKEAVGNENSQAETSSR